MLVGVLSDIHSNVFALRAILRDAWQAGAREIWACGDVFGYYPWAAETFRLLDRARPEAVLGNHDVWVADVQQAPAHAAGEVARVNNADLVLRTPAALDWLAKLEPTRVFERNGWKITMAHGTPADPLEGRYYPDDGRPHAWLPGAGEILILGQTHYPMVRGEGSCGLLLNPGSVGQPRDRNPMPSWALLDLATGRASLRRSSYDNRAVMARLRHRAWDERITAALDKR